MKKKVYEKQLQQLQSSASTNVNKEAAHPETFPSNAASIATSTMTPKGVDYTSTPRTNSSALPNVSTLIGGITSIVTGLKGDLSTHRTGFESQSNNSQLKLETDERERWTPNDRQTSISDNCDKSRNINTTMASSKTLTYLQPSSTIENYDINSFKHAASYLTQPYAERQYIDGDNKGMHFVSADEPPRYEQLSQESTSSADVINTGDAINTGAHMKRFSDLPYSTYSNMQVMTNEVTSLGDAPSHTLPHVYPPNSHVATDWEQENGRYVNYTFQNHEYLDLNGNTKGDELMDDQGSDYTDCSSDTEGLPSTPALPGSAPVKHTVRRRRKRVQTPNQRSAANMRERRRMCHLNVAFDHLKQHLPNVKDKKKMSRIQTLRAAIYYIHLLRDSLA